MSDLQSNTPIIDDAFAELEGSPKLIENRVQFRRRLAALELAANGLRDQLAIIQLGRHSHVCDNERDPEQCRKCGRNFRHAIHYRVCESEATDIQKTANLIADFATITKQPAEPHE